MHSILVVEDDHAIRVTLRAALESMGWLVFTAANGIDGIMILKRINLPCIILLDQMMPLMDGEGFLKIKNNDKELAPIPVIVLSAVSDRITHLGAVGFLKKLVDLDLLFESIRKYCGEHLEPLETANEG